MTMLNLYPGPMSRAIAASAEYLESVFDMSKVAQNPDAKPELKVRAKRRLEELRVYTLDACTKASLKTVPLELAKEFVKERREHRRACEKTRRGRGWGECAPLLWPPVSLETG